MLKFKKHIFLDFLCFFSFFGFFENISKTWVKNWVATKVLQMIESNNYVIKLPLNFDISSTFNMKDLSIYKIQPIPDSPFDTPTY